MKRRTALKTFGAALLAPWGFLTKGIVAPVVLGVDMGISSGSATSVQLVAISEKRQQIGVWYFETQNSTKDDGIGVPVCTGP